jgi:hypothetical protein
MEDIIIKKALETVYPKLVKNEFKASQYLQRLVHVIRTGSETMREEHVQELVSLMNEYEKGVK